MPVRCPERIVCLTEETTETLYLLGEERRIVGISGYYRALVAIAGGEDAFSNLCLAGATAAGSRCTTGYGWRRAIQIRRGLGHGHLSL